MKLVDAMQKFDNKGFEFSAVRPDTLGATEYTLVNIVVDITGSVSPYSADILKMQKAIIEACQYSPRSDYLLVRIVEFNQKINEIHGFTPLSSINVDQYIEPNCFGGTALIDATYSSVNATNIYGKTLADQDYLVNSILFVITDGDDNASRLSTTDVVTEMKKAVSGEFLESSRAILIGINPGQSSSYLKKFKDAVGFDQYEEVSNVTPASLAKLANFVSKSISAQSQSLGTGGASQALVF